MTHPQPADQEERGSLGAAISNCMVRLTAEYTGRGPTRARTYLNDDLVVCIMHGSLTKGERSLVDRGETSTVLGMRKAFQNAMRAEAVEAVEQLTGRRVVTFLSDNTVDPDVAAETFVLAPIEGRDRAAAVPD